MEVQTRSSRDGLDFFKSVKDAHTAYVMNNSIWKISWNENRFCTKNRTQNIKNDQERVLEEARLCKLSTDYANCTDPTKVFWVNEPLSLVSDYNVLKMRMDIIKESFENTLSEKLIIIQNEIKLKFPDGFSRENAIIEVLTDDQFQTKYC